MLAIVYNFFLAKRVKEQRRLNYEEVWVCFILWIYFGKEVEGAIEVKRGGGLGLFYFVDNFFVFRQIG